MKGRLCPKCSTLLLPAVTSTVRIEGTISVPMIIACRHANSTSFNCLCRALLSLTGCSQPLVSGIWWSAATPVGTSDGIDQPGARSSSSLNHRYQLMLLSVLLLVPPFPDQAGISSYATSLHQSHLSSTAGGQRNRGGCDVSADRLAR